MNLPEPDNQGDTVTPRVFKLYEVEHMSLVTMITLFHPEQKSRLILSMRAKKKSTSLEIKKKQRL